MNDKQKSLDSIKGGQPARTNQSQKDTDRFEDTTNFEPSNTPTQSFSFDPEATHAHVAKVSPRELQIDIPGYKILGELGRGGMGVVYKARQELADRIVALKLLLNSDHAGQAEISRFKVEAQASARLHHPNIVQVHDVGQVGELPYFTLEYVEGGTLAKRLAKQTLSVCDAAKLMLTLAEATAYAHSRGVVHRDLKPANILLTGQGDPKIADFGLARRTDDVSHLTIEGTILGTPSYMSPEQALGDHRQIGPLSDLYSLGAILYELLTGRPPFKAASAWEVISQVRSIEPTPPSLLEPKIPRDLETICVKCLQKSPEKRYASTQLMADDLRRYLNNEPISARPTGSFERVVRLCRRYPREARLAGLVAGLLVTMTVGTAFAAYRFNMQRQEIEQEKLISDQRLNTYRSTVSPMVNTIPKIIDAAPLASGLRDELMTELQTVFEKSVDTGAVGPSKQWGLEAIAIRRGNLLLTQAEESLNLSDETETAAKKLGLAAEQFEAAIRIAQAVYDSHPEDMAKATANLAIPVSKLAYIRHRQNIPLAEVVPLYKKAIELRREALASENKSELKTMALRQAELGTELLLYSAFLLEARDQDPIRFATRALEFSTEAGGLIRQALVELSSNESASADTRLQLGMADALIAKAAERLGQFGLANDSYRECVAVHRELCQDFPNRYTYRKQLINYSNEYADYLMRQHADPNLIAEQFATAMKELRQMLHATELRAIFNGSNGLANQFYRAGLVELLRGNRDSAKPYFERCALMRELAWRTSLDENSQSNDMDRVITQRIELMIAQSRSGITAPAIEHALWLSKRADELTANKMDKVQAAAGFSAPWLYVMAASGFSLASEHLDGEEKIKQIQRALAAVKRAIDIGYRDAAYLREDPDFSQLQELAEYKQLISNL